MAEPASHPVDELEQSVDAAIALCDGDVRAALRAALVYNEFLERKLDMMRGMVSAGYSRGRITPWRQAADRLERWREISAGADNELEP